MTTTHATDKRVKSREGFVLADAVIGKVGPLDYLRGELGLDGDPNGVVKLNRSAATIRKALPTMVGKPVTIGHPTPFLGTGDARLRAVGAIASEPTLGGDGLIRAKVSVWDRKAVSLIENGTDQLSPGFVFSAPKIVGDEGEIENMQVNHLAIVPKGRAGEQVRIMDELPPGLLGIDEETLAMGDQEKLVAAIRAAVGDAFKEASPSGASAADVEARLADSMSKALQPVLDELASVKEQRAKDEAAAKEKEAADAKAKEIKEAVDEAVKVERGRAIVIADAKPFIDETRHAELADMEPEDVLRLAIGDSVEGTDKMDLATLNGVFIGIQAAADRASVEPSADPTGSALFRKPTKQATDAAKRKSLANIADRRFRKARGMDENDEEME